MPEEKTCSKCGETKPLEDFPLRKDSKDGRLGRCRVCQLAYHKEWRDANPEHLKEYRRTHPPGEKAIAAKRLWNQSEEGREAKNEWRRQWRADNPEAWALENRRYVGAYKARKRGATVERVDLARVLELHGLVCHLCKEIIVETGGTNPGSLVFDHVVPLSKGGAHSEANLRPAHFVCNGRKGARII